MHYNQVGVWRSRSPSSVSTGLFDEERPGRPPVYTHDDVIRLVSFDHRAATRWRDALDDGGARGADGRARCAISASQVWRICQALDLKPWQTQSWMTSHDPDFWEKAARRVRPVSEPARERGGVVGGREVPDPSQVAGATRPSRPGPAPRPDATTATPVTAPSCCSPRSTCTRATSPAGSPTPPAPRTSSSSSPTSSRYTPKGLELHCIVDNLSAHATPHVEAFLDKHRHVFLHNTPTHASWLNQVELFFSILERTALAPRRVHHPRRTRRPHHRVHQGLQPRARPFRWTYDGRPLKVA